MISRNVVRAGWSVSIQRIDRSIKPWDQTPSLKANLWHHSDDWFSYIRRKVGLISTEMGSSNAGFFDLSNNALRNTLHLHKFGLSLKAAIDM